MMYIINYSNMIMNMYVHINTVYIEHTQSKLHGGSSMVVVDNSRRH